MNARYQMKRDALNGILNSLHARRGKKIVRYATIKDVIAYVNREFGLRYQIVSIIPIDQLLLFSLDKSTKICYN